MEEDKKPKIEQSKSWAISIDGPILIALLIISAGCSTYSIYSRGAVEFLRLPFAASLTLAVAMFLLSLQKNEKGGFRKIWACLKASVLAWLVFFLIAIAFSGNATSAFDTYDYARKSMTLSGQFSLLVGFSTLIVGTLFFCIRVKYRATYGLTEVLAGIAISSYRAYGQTALETNDEINFYLIILTAGIYLVVRGLDNINQGREQGGDPVIRLMRWLKAQVYTDAPEKVAAMYGDPSSQPVKDEKSEQGPPDTSH